MLDLQRALPQRSRAVVAAELHVTLAYLGDCDAGGVVEARRWLAQHAVPRAAPRLAAACLLGAGRALAFDLSAVEGLARWMEAYHASRVPSADLEAPAFAARPHLTVAWLRQRSRSDDQRGAVLSRLSAWTGLAVECGQPALWCRAAAPDPRRYCLIED
ncbi:MAG TPA: hypothetical protein VFQ88_00455 [Nevskiaceae bacterium]|nr:hypothetical protein [Nevskiaceae bacterium]